MVPNSQITRPSSAPSSHAVQENSSNSHAQFCNSYLKALKYNQFPDFLVQKKSSMLWNLAPSSQRSKKAADHLLDQDRRYTKDNWEAGSSHQASYRGRASGRDRAALACGTQQGQSNQEGDGQSWGTWGWELPHSKRSQSLLGAEKRLPDTWRKHTILWENLVTVESTKATLGLRRDHGIQSVLGHNLELIRDWSYYNGTTWWGLAGLSPGVTSVFSPF